MKAIALLKVFSIAGLSLAITATGASVAKIKPKTNTAPAQVQYVKTSQISLDEAIDIAVTDAKVLRESAKFTETKADKSETVPHYDIEFVAGSKEYDYEIALSDGKILKREAEESAFSANKSAKTETNKVGYIGVDAAKAAALKKASLSSSQVKFKEAKLDFDGGTAHYDIEFISGSCEYEFEIDAVTGDTVKYQKEYDNDKASSAPKTSAENGITLAEAKAIALKKVSLSASQVKFTKAISDTDDGILYYDIEFISGNYEYEFEIRAKDSKITDFDKEKAEVKASASKPSKSEYITSQKAQSIALSHAKLKAEQVKGLKAEFEKENGLAVFEVEFEYGKYEYEYKINAENGKIILAEKETD